MMRLLRFLLILGVGLELILAGADAHYAIAAGFFMVFIQTFYAE